MTRVALVTGASRNIGRGIALSLVSDGFEVACFGRDKAALEETAGLIRDAGGVASVHVGDVASDESLEAFAKDAVAQHGGIDLVVNNAGIMHDAKVADVTPDKFRQVLDVNLVSCYTLARAAYPHLRERKGVVVNVGSMFASMGVPSAASYCTSKAAIDGLTRALASEWARDGIRVVAVAPGYVLSDISRDMLTDPVSAKQILSRIPARRHGEPGEIGDLVAFLASPKAGFITGESFVIDGGQRMSV
ncbi:MAG: SDR family oxidoreductase [Rhodobacteraceae bacterium]|nr:SDR family oxidoreductase [Paracoccaceae bacterium]